MAPVAASGSRPASGFERLDKLLVATRALRYLAVMSIAKVTFNGVDGRCTVARPWIQALNDAKLVLEKAGFLFKAGLTGDRMLLAVEPCLIQGERRYHFNMHLAHEDAYTLIGSVNAQGEFTILFKPESPELSPGQCARYREVIGTFAAFLLDGGYTGEGLLDEVTQALLGAVGFDPVPDRLSGIRDACL